MENIATLSPKKQVQKEYIWAVFWFMVGAVIPLDFLRTSLRSALNQRGIHDTSNNGVFVFLLAMQLAKYFAKWWCRRKGSSHLILGAVNIQVTVPDFSGELVQWSRPQRESKATLQGLFSGAVVCLLALCLIYFHDGPTSLVGFSAVIFLALANSDGNVYGWATDVRIDSTGLTFRRVLRPRRHVAWVTVSEYEIQSLANPVSQGEESDLLIFKDAGGKVLTRMELGAWPWRSTREIREIESEIKCRMTGEWVTFVVNSLLAQLLAR